jgi:hypothetical protein
MLLELSATYADLSSGDMMMDEGKLNKAIEPTPSLWPPLVEPVIPEPAKVVTSAVVIMILRILWLLLSTTRR